MGDQHGLLRLYPGEPQGRSNLHWRNERYRAPYLRTSDQGRSWLHFPIQYNTACLVRNLRRSDFSNFPRKRIEEMEAGLENSVDRIAKSAMERFVRVDL